MPIQHDIWTVGEQPTGLAVVRLESEQKLEDMIVREPGILSSQWMLIGRQEVTGFGGRIDLLAIAPDASLVLIELKRDRTPRELVAQALDYAAWVEQLTAEKISQIYQRFSVGKSLSESFRARFGVELDEDALNESHQIVLVAAELDPSTERIINYLNARDIAVNAIFFRVFEHKGEQLLSRAWLIDPRETQANVVVSTQPKSGKEPWNGEYYVSFGDLAERSWEDARKYGFISAGGGSWYSQTLRMLSPGDRVWVKIPQTGYVGVGRVVGESVAFKDFKIKTANDEKPAADLLEHAANYKEYENDPDLTEYFVRIEWLDTVPVEKAFNEIGLFGNQNTVCQPQTPKWRHTVERLKGYFAKWNKE